MKRRFRKQLNRRTMMVLVLFCFLIEVFGATSVFCECFKTSAHTDFSSSNAKPFTEISQIDPINTSFSYTNYESGLESVEQECNLCNTGNEQHFIKKALSKRTGLKKFAHKKDNFGSPILLVSIAPHNYGLPSSKVLFKTNSSGNETLSNLRTVVLLN